MKQKNKTQPKPKLKPEPKPKTQGSELYLRVIEPGPDPTMRMVWGPTPWVVDAHTGSDVQEVVQWCKDRFGPESSPIHQKQGTWHLGSVTIYGVTWMGFKTKEMMDQFTAHWPNTRGKT